MYRNRALEDQQQRMTSRAEKISICALNDTERLTVSSMKSHMNSVCDEGDSTRGFVTW